MYDCGDVNPFMSRRVTLMSGVGVEVGLGVTASLNTEIGIGTVL